MTFKVISVLVAQAKEICADFFEPSLHIISQ
jgi:hypothetical protein